MSQPAEPHPLQRFVITSKYRTARGVWDLCMFLDIVVICVVVPLRIGFLLFEWEEWLPVDITVDLLLFLDIFVNALSSFEHDGEEVTNPRDIFRRYVRNWFILDVLSVVPLEVFGPLLVTAYHPALRANRLIRVGRLIEYFNSWERVSSLKPSVIRICKSIFVVLLLAHFIGCIFHLIILLEGDDAKPDFTGTVDIHGKTLGSRYIRSFYWSFVTMTGYNNTNPTTQVETVFSIFVTLTGISLFATIIGTVGSLVTNLDSSKLYFRQKMDGVNDYMKYKKIPDELQSEVRNYYLYLWKSGKGLDKNKVLDDLPPYLKNKMDIYLNRELIQKVPLFEACKSDNEFINEVIKLLKPRICLPNSFIVRKGDTGTEMYFVLRGELNVVNNEQKVVTTLCDGSFFGEIALLEDTKRTASIVARTYCDILILTKEDFQIVLHKFPQHVAGIQTIANERWQSAKKNTTPAQIKQEEEEFMAQGDEGDGNGGGDEEMEMKDASGFETNGAATESNPLATSNE
jgi:CRP-like cAMP-binding protein